MKYIPGAFFFATCAALIATAQNTGISIESTLPDANGAVWQQMSNSGSSLNEIIPGNNATAIIITFQ